MKMNYPIVRLLCSLLGLLISEQAIADMTDINRIYRTTPTLNQIEVCHGGGCVQTGHVALTLEEWRQVTKLYATPSQHAAEERVRVATSIGVFESIVGRKIGTANDKAGTFNMQYAGQLDCNDEAINSTTYLRLLKQSGYLLFHDVEDMRTRDFFFTGWPHTTAVMHDIKTGERFAVDSWFYDNGHAATIVPFDAWKDGYHPEDSPVYRESAQ